MTARAPRSVALAVALPELIPTFVAGFGLVAMVALISHSYHVPVVLPVGALVGLLAAALRWRGLDRDHAPAARDRWSVLVVFAGVAVWTVWNVLHTAQDLKAERDPATYLLTAQWLAAHGQLPIATGSDVFGAVPGLDPASAGFSAINSNELYAQGNHLFPALIAVGGRFGGLDALFRADAVISGLALVALFGLARRIVGPWPAVAVTAAMAAGLPMIYVARDAFSEPLTLLLVCGGLAQLTAASRTRRVADLGLAALCIGSTAMARIDGQVVVAALVPVIAVLLATAPAGRRRAAVLGAAAMVVAAAVPSLLGFWDVAWLSSGYFHDQHHNIVTVLTACVALLVVLLPLAVLTWWAPFRRHLSDPVLLRRAGLAAGALVVVGFLLAVSRPFWNHPVGPTDNLFLETVQRAQGLGVDGYRLYDEYTLYWQAMYLGWPAVVLAFGGFVLVLRALFVRRRIELLGSTVVGGALSVLYLATSQITPDQPWAMRRYVPVVMPMLLIWAMYAVVGVWRERARVRWAARPTAVALTAVVVAWPVVVSWPSRSVRDQYPLAADVAELCRVLSPHGAVLALDEDARLNYGQTVRGVCDVPASSLVTATRAQLAEVDRAAAAHGRVLYGLATDPDGLHLAPAGTEPFVSQVVQRWPTTLQRVPDGAQRQTLQIYLLRIGADGSMTPVSSAP